MCSGADVLAAVVAMISASYAFVSSNYACLSNMKASQKATVAKEMCEGEREIMEAPDTKLMSSFFFFFFAVKRSKRKCFSLWPVPYGCKQSSSFSLEFSFLAWFSG